MALSKQEVNISLSGALNTKSDDKIVGSDGALTVENADYNKTGSIIKRRGSIILTNDAKRIYRVGTITDADRVTNLNFDSIQPDFVLKNKNQTVVVPKAGNQEVYKYVKASNKFISDTEDDSIQVLPPQLSNKTIYSGNDYSYYQDFAYSSKFKFYFYSAMVAVPAPTSTANLLLGKLDEETGNRQIATRLGVGGEARRCFINDEDDDIENAKLILFRLAGADLIVQSYDYDFTNVIVNNTYAGVLQTGVNLISCKRDNDNNIYCTVIDGAGRFRVFKTDSSGVLITNVIVTPTTPLSASRYVYDTCISDTNLSPGRRLLIVYKTTGNALASIVLDEDLNVITNSTTIVPSPQPTYAQTITLSNDVNDTEFAIGLMSVHGNPSLYNNEDAIVFFRYNFTGNTGTINTTQFITGMGQPSNVILRQTNSVDRYYFICHSGNTSRNSEQRNSYLVSFNYSKSGTAFINDISCIGRYNIGASRGIASSAKLFDWGPEKIIMRSYGIDFLTKVLSGFNYVTIESAETVYSPQNFYGLALFSFNFDDSTNRSITATLGGSTLINGALPLVYDGESLYEQGFLLNPYIISSSTTAGATIPAGTYTYRIVFEYINNNGEVEESAPSNALEVTHGGVASVTIKYNSTNLGRKSSPKVVLYRTEASGNISYKTVEASISGSITDTLTDSELIANKVLYTEGNVLSNDSLPPSKFLHSTKSRIFSINAETSGKIDYSKFYSNGLGVNFSDFLNLQSSDKDKLAINDFTAISSLDDKVVLFKQDEIYVFNGDGPSDTGDNSSFSELQRITADVGCATPRSVVSTPMGVMFKSEKGIYNLDRGLSINYIGASVERYNSYEIVSAFTNDKENKVFFILSSLGTLVYDYINDRWNLFTGVFGSDGYLFGNDVIYLKNNRLYQTQDNIFQDNLINYSLKIVTPWYKVSGIQNFGRIWRTLIIGKYKSAHDLIVKVYYDYDDSISATYTIKPKLSDKQYQYQIGLEKQKCQAIKFEIYDTNQSGTGESMELTDLTMIIGKKAGTYKLPKNRKY